jgi:hypothetical protein
MAPRATVIEEMITQRVVAAGIRLRFDKVALRLLDGVKASVAQALPAGQTIAFTVTAPIKLPAKTSAALQQWLHRLPTHGLSTTINGNQIRARIINHTANDMQRVIGFVHNAESNADLALDIAETSLRER